MAIFVVGSFDKDQAATFCDPGNNAHLCTDLGPSASNPVGNMNANMIIKSLWVAPYLDYTCCIIWAFVGLILWQRGDQIEKLLEQQKHNAEILQEIAASSAQPAAHAGQPYEEAVPVTVSGNY